MIYALKRHPEGVHCALGVGRKSGLTCDSDLAGKRDPRTCEAAS